MSDTDDLLSNVRVCTFPSVINVPCSKIYRHSSINKPFPNAGMRMVPADSMQHASYVVQISAYKLCQHHAPTLHVENGHTETSLLTCMVICMHGMHGHLRIIYMVMHASTTRSCMPQWSSTLSCHNFLTCAESAQLAGESQDLFLLLLFYRKANFLPTFYQHFTNILTVYEAI